jgi:hypothetical protein
MSNNNSAKAFGKVLNRIPAILGFKFISKKKYDKILRQKKIYNEVLSRTSNSDHGSLGGKSQENPQFIFYEFAILECKEQSGHNLLWMTHDRAGIFSCLTTAMWSVLQASGEGKTCHEINNSFSMSFFKNEKWKCTWGELFKKKSKTEIEAIMNVAPISHKIFDHHSNYETILNSSLGPQWAQAYLSAYMSPSDAVLEQTNSFIQKYKILDRNTITVCYRGTDKYTEITPTPLFKYFDRIEEILANEEDWQIIIQTDQKQILDLFSKRYGEKCIRIEELPVTTGKKAIHSNKKLCGDREMFAVNLLAMCLAVSKSKYLITHTGNVGLFLALNSLLAGNKVIQLDLEDANGQPYEAQR